MNSLSCFFSKTSKTDFCKKEAEKEILPNLIRRLILPFYILVISLVGSSLIIEPKSKYLNKFHKMNIFLIGVFTIILSQLGLKLLISSNIILYLIIFLPLLLVFVYYLILMIRTKFKLSLL